MLALRSDGSVQYYLTFGANGLLSMHNTAVSTDDRYFTFDLSGATVARLAPNQSAQYTIGAQSSFGWCNPTDTMGGMGAQWGYFCDGATGLILCTHRFYDPANGRWLTRDPMGYRGGINLYGYVGNDPVNEVDPSGHAQIVIIPTTGLPGAIGIIDHEFIRTQCGGSGPPQTIGFWPNGGSFFGPGGTLNGMGGIYGGDNDDGRSDDKTGIIDDWNGDPAFGKRLCACIAASAASHPTWSLGGIAEVNPPLNNNNYVCYSWADDMWDCAGGDRGTWPIGDYPIYGGGGGLNTRPAN